MIVNDDNPSTNTSIAGRNRRHIQAPSAKGAKPAGYWDMYEKRIIQFKQR